MNSHSCAICGQATTKKCARCQTAYFCSKECQQKALHSILTANFQAWPEHKKNCSFDGGLPIPLGSANHPSILLISFGKEDWFDKMYEHLLKFLKAKATFYEATNPAEYTALIDGPSVKLTAILITTSEFSERKYSAIHARVVEYAKAGGTVIFCGLFSSMISPPKMTEMWHSKWNLPWQSGGYHRTTFSLNPHLAPKLGTVSSLPPAYSMKAVQLS